MSSTLDPSTVPEPAEITIDHDTRVEITDEEIAAAEETEKHWFHIVK